MIERGTILRGFVALLLLAAALSGVYALASNTDGSSGNFLEDGREGWHYGAIYEQPGATRQLVDVDRWLRDLPVRGGTYGRTLPAQARITFDGSGPIPSRDVTLESAAAVDLFEGERRERAEDVLRGVQRILEERDGLIRGLVLTKSYGGAEAAAISNVVRLHVADGIDDPAERRLVSTLIQEVSSELAGETWAWYSFRFQEIVLGPEISRGLERWIRTPDASTPEQNIFTAHVLRHEIEHAVSPATQLDSDQLQWIEEGSADVLARWPGAAAATARELGMTYPKRYERMAYEPTRSGYPTWVATMRVLLGACGIDVQDPAAIDDAARLLQDGDVTGVPERIAERIATRNRLTEREERRLAAGIRGLDGDTRAARRIVTRP